MQLPENLLRLSSATLVRGGGCIAILLGVYIGYEVGHRVYLRAFESKISWHAAQVYNAKSWHRMMSIKAADLNNTAQGEPQLIAFSPVDFQRESARLVSWVPLATGGDMSLEMPWQQVPATFSMLADRDMQVMAFSLSAEKGVLHLTLQLVRDDES